MAGDPDYSVSSDRSDCGTTGCPTYNARCDYVLSGTPEVIVRLREAVGEAKTDSLRDQVGSFCSCLSAAIAVRGIRYALPGFHVDEDEDEFYLEWAFDHFRFGFDFYEDREQSGWFLLMKGEDGMFRYKSKFDGDYRKAVDYALSVIDGGPGHRPSSPSCQERHPAG